LPDSSQAIKSAKNLIKSNTIKSKLLEIIKLDFLTKAIKDLQNQGLKVSQQMEILNSVKEKLHGKSLEKIEKSLLKNPDLKKFINISNNYNFKIATKYSPLVSVDVERSFSQYKDILSEKRQRMTKLTIEHLNVICFNNFLTN
jgi:hypothetical protein